MQLQSEHPGQLLQLFQLSLLRELQLKEECKDCELQLNSTAEGDTGSEEQEAIVLQEQLPETCAAETGSDTRPGS